MRFALFILIMLTCVVTIAQPGYKTADLVADFHIKTILNHSGTVNYFRYLKKKLTIVDFFGTWCSPCIKALPHLVALQEKYSSNLAVILISTESATKLERFIALQKQMPFPVVVDADKSISDLFQPPAYPYTIVINQKNEIIAVTEAGDITDVQMQGWLNNGDLNKDDKQPSGIIDTLIKLKPTTTDKRISSKANELSEQFIYASKTGAETSSLESELQRLNFDSLTSDLSSDENKKAFWINIYNGYTQLLLKKDPGKYSSRNKFFKDKQIPIAGKRFSLDNIEHDILRRSKIKWSLGYLNKMFNNKTHKALRVKKLDYRVHFALNCGAKSCPPIAFYEADKIETQLEAATRSYLSSEAVYDKEKNTLQLPAIMSWFRHDFNGKKGMTRILKKHKLIPENQKPSITFKKYDWNLFLNNYN